MNIFNSKLLFVVCLFAATVRAESEADQSARICRNAVVTFAARDPLGDNAREQCEGDKPAAHTPKQWQCVVDSVTEGRSLYAAENDCFKVQ